MKDHTLHHRTWAHTYTIHHENPM
jgi:hypothetical protein